MRQEAKWRVKKQSKNVKNKTKRIANSPKHACNTGPPLHVVERLKGGNKNTSDLPKRVGQTDPPFQVVERLEMMVKKGPVKNPKRATKHEGSHRKKEDGVGKQRSLFCSMLGSPQNTANDISHRTASAGTKYLNGDRVVTFATPYLRGPIAPAQRSRGRFRPPSVVLETVLHQDARPLSSMRLTLMLTSTASTSTPALPAGWLGERAVKFQRPLRSSA